MEEVNSQKLIYSKNREERWRGEKTHQEEKYLDEFSLFACFPFFPCFSLSFVRKKDMISLPLPLKRRIWDV